MFKTHAQSVRRPAQQDFDLVDVFQRPLKTFLGPPLTFGAVPLDLGRGALVQEPLDHDAALPLCELAVQDVADALVHSQQVGLRAVEGGRSAVSEKSQS